MAASGTDPAPADVVATVTALTARTVAGAIAPFGVTELVAAGGGTRNPVLTAALAEAIAPARLVPIEDAGLPSAAKEAYAFAVLGFLTVHGLPGTIAAATGARHPSLLGAIVPGRDGFPAVAPADPPARIAVVTGG